MHVPRTQFTVSWTSSLRGHTLCWNQTHTGHSIDMRGPTQLLGLLLIYLIGKADNIGNLFIWLWSMLLGLWKSPHVTEWIVCKFVFYSRFSGSRCDIHMIQSPTSLFATLRESVTITCQVSDCIYGALAWYHKKPEKSLMLLIHDAISLADGVQSRFVGSGDGRQYSFKISSLQSEGFATYYCHQRKNLTLTVIQVIT